MTRKRIFSLLIGIAMILPLFPCAVSADAPMEVYTDFISGNNSHTGSGTQKNPYNLFEDALAAVADGGTIYIGEKGAFVNDKSDGMPFQITKNVTVTRAADIVSHPCIVVRTGGIVLGADVTFSDVVLSLPNANHAAVCANGYTLTLNNVSYDDSAREIHLAGGGMYNLNGAALSPAAGEHSKIIISGKDTCFGNIYAGSINGAFDKAVDIEINGVSGTHLSSIYASGAQEGYYNGENFLDPNNQPLAPTADSSVYPVTAPVSVSINDGGVRSIDGATGGNDNVHLTVSSTYLYQSELKNIANLTVQRGVFQPSALNDSVNVNVMEGAALDMSLFTDCAVNDFSGGGTLVLSRSGSLTINGACTGTTELKTDGAGVAEYDHLYVKTTGDGIFKFSSSFQTEMTLNKTAEGWRTSEQLEIMTALTKFGVDTSAIVFTKSQINGKDIITPELSVTAEFTEDTYISDIGMVPLEYTVIYNGNTIYALSTALTEYEGYYEGNITELNMNFSPVGDAIVISNLSETYGNMGEIAEGIYDITITAPTVTGNVTCNVRLTVTDDEGTPPCPAAPAVETVTYGAALSEITLGGGWNWAEPDIVPTVINSGYSAHCSVDDVNCDYSGVEGYNAENHRIERIISLTVNKAVPAVSLDAPRLQITGENRSVHLTAYVAGAENGEMPVGQITFTDGDTEIGTANIVNGSAEITWQNVPVGIYTIKAVYSGDNNYLTAYGETEYSLETLTVTGEQTGNINVIFTNLNDKAVNNAIMFAAAYDVDGVLQRIEKSEQSVNTEAGSTQEFKFDMTSVNYDIVRVFVWDSFETMIPII